MAKYERLCSKLLENDKISSNFESLVPVNGPCQISEFVENCLKFSTVNLRYLEIGLSNTRIFNYPVPRVLNPYYPVPDPGIRFLFQVSDIKLFAHNFWTTCPISLKFCQGHYFLISLPVRSKLGKVKALKSRVKYILPTWEINLTQQ